MEKLDFKKEYKDLYLPKTNSFIQENHYQHAISDRGPDGMVRRHHEIYLGDPYKTEPDKLKTVIRCPVKQRQMTE